MGEDDPTTTTQLSPFLQPFPDPGLVFAEAVAEHRRVLQPLLSIEASRVDPAWKGFLHFVTPIEPYEGGVGGNTRRFHSRYCTENWIAFRVQDSRYKFMSDFRYFEINGEGGAQLQAHYEERKSDYAETKRYFEETGELRPPRVREWAAPWIRELGGLAEDGNWASHENRVRIEHILREDGVVAAYPLTRDNRPFRFVGSVPGDCYFERGPDRILLFFDPRMSIALLTFDWT